MAKIKHYRIEDTEGNSRTLTASNIVEAIGVWNKFKTRHPEAVWKFVLGTLDQFSLLKR